MCGCLLAQALAQQRALCAWWCCSLRRRKMCGLLDCFGSNWHLTGLVPDWWPARVHRVERARQHSSWAGISPLGGPPWGACAKGMAMGAVQSKTGLELGLSRACHAAAVG